jgi:hypothetical protein
VLTFGCGGSDSDSDAGSSGSPGAASGDSATGDDSSDDAEGGGAADEDDENALLSAFENAEPRLPDNLPPGTDTTLGGTPYYAAAAAITQTLAENGISLPGFEVYVLPIGDTGGALLVFEAEATVDAAALPDDATPALRALLDSEAVQDANITRFVLNLHGEDAQGPFLMTLTMPLDALGKMLDQTLTDEEAATQVLLGVERQ